MNGPLHPTKDLSILSRWLELEGFSGTDVRVQEKLLVIRLAGQQGSRLLADQSLRERLTAQAMVFGFDRVSLELDHGETRP